MRRIALAGGCAALLLFLLGLSPSVAGAFTQCPAVGADTGCQFLITVSDSGQSFQSDATQPPYENLEDALIGVQNNSSKPLASITLSSAGASANPLFGFENDGMCDAGSQTRPDGSAGPGPPAGCVEPSGTACPSDNSASDCAFPPPPGEPANYNDNGGGSGTTVGTFANGDMQTGYEGPTSWFSGVANSDSSGVVNFSPPIAPNSSTFFSLEEPPASGIAVGSPTTIPSTTLSGAGQTGPSISVVQGTGVTDRATIAGPNAAAAGGSVSFTVFSDPACTKGVANAGSAAVTNGASGPSTSVASLAPGTYYWQASYSGDSQNQPSTSPCGSEVLHVQTPTTTSTTLTGGKVSGAKITVPSGTSVTDQARIGGAGAATAGGTVTYALYRNNTCTQAVGGPSSAAVVNGVGRPSAAVKPAPGTYYWRAVYSGDATHGPSSSACGSEVLSVPASRSLGLPSSRACLSRRAFVVHPRIPKHAKLATATVFINGSLTKRVKFGKRVSFVNLKNLPKGTFTVAIIVTTKAGQTFQDHRRYHTCRPKKH
jgi:hypothetical protein